MSNTDVLATEPGVNPGKRLLVLGGGYTGLRFARAAITRGFAVQLTSRRPPPAAEGGLEWLAFDSESDEGGAASRLEGITHVLVTGAPNGAAGDPFLPLLGATLRRQPLQWVGYLSTTGVYGSSEGAWVDESSPTQPRPGRSRQRLDAEQAWRAMELPLQILRLPAIYGPHRCPFDSLRQGSCRLVHKPAQVFSRVHVDDIVGAALHSLALPPADRPAVLNVCDDCPCPSSETLGYAAHLLGLKLPPVQRYADIEPGLSAMARSFWVENRRTSNRLLHALGYRLLYPSYREGFRASLAEEVAEEVASGSDRAGSLLAGTSS
jgi:nucleoside-diphosphate-sugar epimerase